MLFNSMHILIFTVLAALATTTVNAHFEVTRPPPRGAVQQTQKQFCGGFPNPSNPRTPLSTFNASLDVTLYWNGAIDVFLGFGPNATVFPYKLGTQTPALQGESYTIPLDFSSVPKELLVEGAVGTIQAVCHFSPTVDLFQCNDVVVDKEGVRMVSAGLPATAAAAAAGVKTTTAAVTTFAGAAATATTTTTTTKTSGSSAMMGGVGVVVGGVVACFTAMAMFI
ncbi:hypothetical protein HDU96_002842 [Phlyctochytrium bullatum]|nr:hypothetical protein HDU96_002842 [Phlyctochytrium bullatum]